MPDTTQYYRYVDSPTYVVLEVYPVLKRTPKGVWLDLFGRKRFVREDATKQWACPTREAAWESFRARKRRQVSILRAKLKRAQAALLADRPADGQLSELPRAVFDSFPGLSSGE